MVFLGPELMCHDSSGFVGGSVYKKNAQADVGARNKEGAT